MTTRGTWTMAVSVLAVLAVAGCAKHPITTPTAAAPAPSGTPSSAATPSRMAPATANVARAASTGSSQATPGAQRANPADFKTQTALHDVHFDFDRADIRPVDQPILDADATWLNAHQHDAVLVEGHADERGTSEYNLALGERRAKATRDYLVSHGVAAARITVISYGFEHPLCGDHTEACWAQNRRSHFLAKAQ